MKRFILEKSDDEFYTSHSGRALIGLGVNRQGQPEQQNQMGDSETVILYVTRPSVEGFGQLSRSSCTGRQDLLQPAENSN